MVRIYTHFKVLVTKRSVPAVRYFSVSGRVVIITKGHRPVSKHSRVVRRCVIIRGAEVAYIYIAPLGASSWAVVVAT